ncbi:MAG: hypothetical protein DWQ01_01885 [Planctomycetota bacterium]|nr:MAG: hypothetical protein DWQ01_01885 [Planctomycetota bacterium]
MKSRLPLIFAGFLCVLPLLGSGISTHFEAADRAIVEVDEAGYPDLEALLRRHAQILKVASVFPDWGYLFEDTVAAAEASHWPPFHTTGLEYLHQTYGDPWSDHAERLFVFLCGLVCHGAMDDVWHFGDTAFLVQARQQDLPDWDPDLAETAIEALTDFFVQYEHRSDWEVLDWWIPVRDMVAIANQAGYPEMTQERILFGSAIQKLAARLEDMFASLVYAPAKEFLPWTEANYLDWWDGGVADGARYSARRMEAYWDEYQSLSGNGPTVGLSSQPDHDHPCPQPMFVDLARTLVTNGWVQLRWESAENGGFRIQTAALVAPEKVQASLNALNYGP